MGMAALGIDIGGTGIKGALVDGEGGALLGERFRLNTPRPATPESVAESVAGIVEHFGWEGPVGAGFPAVVRQGQVCTAANIDDAWIGRDAEAMFREAAGCDFTVLNDADAAGMAEMRFGAGLGRSGVVLVLTIGTGIGSALFTDGRLVPNTEFGHLEMDGKAAEKRASARVRARRGLTWKKWSSLLDAYLRRVAFYLWPELIIIGGGASRRHEKFLPHLTVDCEVVPARLRNEAGIIGAAAAAGPGPGD